MGRRALALAAALGSALAPAALFAAATCSVSAVGPNFGTYTPLSAAPTLANGSVTATCTWTSGLATTVNIVSSYSTGSSGTFAMRTLRSGTNTLNYNLFFDAAFTQVRGDGTGGSQQGGATLTVSSGTRTASTTSVIYGRIPALQDPAAGTYADTIVITLTY
jgi:spore coat protein U-like protein